jgi:aminoglycoside 6'-N-acetyltransferase
MRLPQIKLRKAEIVDIPILKYWDTQEHFIRCHSDDDTQVESDDWDAVVASPPPYTANYIAELDQTPIGVIQIIDPALEESHYWGDCTPNLRAIDIWIGEKQNLSKGYGTKMMQLTFELCFADSAVEAIIIDPLTSNTNAIRFYERLGFGFVEKRSFGEDKCSVYRFERSQWKAK